MPCIMRYVFDCDGYMHLIILLWYCCVLSFFAHGVQLLLYSNPCSYCTHYYSSFARSGSEWDMLVDSYSLDYEVKVRHAEI